MSDIHDVTGFDCGVASLNSWLAEQALRAQSAGTARTFVWVTESEPLRVRAYYSLAPTEIRRAVLSRGQAAGYSVIPGYLLARLALDAELHGDGLGGELLLDAVIRAARAADLSGGRLVVVDALDDRAAAFYRRFDFTPVKGNPHRLVLKIASVRALDANDTTTG